MSSGANFPDALAAVPVSHALDGVTVLVDPDSLDASAASVQLLTDNAAAIRTLLIAGGVDAISDTVRDEAAAIVNDAAG
jgi:putative cell wall-binding protein